jgi:hypothetical protein
VSTIGTRPRRGDTMEWLGGRLERDLVPKRVELANQIAGASFGVGAPCEVVTTEVLVIAVVREEVPDDHQHRVTHREDGLVFTPFAEASSETVELGGEIGVLRAGRGPRRLTERRTQGRVSLASATRAPLAGALVIAGAHPGPGREVAGKENGSCRRRSRRR